MNEYLNLIHFSRNRNQ